MALRILVSGASGLIGTALCAGLVAEGHAVFRLVRRTPRGPDEFSWDPASRTIDFRLMDRSDAVINLSGASLSHMPWTRAYKHALVSSRVHATRTLTDAMRMAAHPPAVFLSASAVGIYGDQPGTMLTEEAPAGDGFLARLVRTWEAAAHTAPEQTRVVTFRSGLVIGRGGAMKPLLPLARLGLAGPIGGGTQHWPWISLLDEAAAIRHLLTSRLSGAVNVVGPAPTAASDLMRTLAHRLHRPYGMPVPRVAIDVILRDAGRELLLSDQQVIPSRLLDDGFSFEHRSVDQAIEWLLSL